MNFQRGGDIKETLKIGRKANAFKISYFEIWGKLRIPIHKNKITEKSICKYNLRNIETGDIEAMIIHTRFMISKGALEHALMILNTDGISKNFDDYIKYLMVKRAQIGRAHV